MAENSLAAFRVMLECAHTASVGDAHHEWYSELSVGSGTVARGMSLKLMEHEIAEATELHLGHGTQSGNGHTD